jgi:hypothetical protein
MVERRQKKTATFSGVIYDNQLSWVKGLCYINVFTNKGET